MDVNCIVREEENGEVERSFYKRGYILEVVRR